MNIVRTIGTGVAWGSAGTIASKIIGFGNIFLILSHLTVYEYGLTELTMSVVSIVGLLLLPGLSPIITADMGVERARREYGKMKALFLEFFTFSMAAGVVAWAVLFFGSSLVAHATGNDLISQLFKVVSFLFLTTPLRAASSMLATVNVRYVDQSLFNVVEEAAKGLWLLFFFFVLGLGTDGLLYAIVLAQLVVVLVFLPRTLSAIHEFWHAKAEPIPFWKLLREHRKWGVASTYIGVAGNSVRMWIIKALLGTEAVGLYGVILGILGHLGGLLPIGSVVTPLIPRYIDKRDELVRLLRASIKVQTFSAAAYVLVGFIAFPILLPFFFPKYASIVPVLIAFSLVLIPQSVLSIITPVFTVLKEQRTQLQAVVLKNALSFLVLPPALFFFGMGGIIIEGILVLSVSLFERYIRLRRLVPEFSFHMRDFMRFDPLERKIISQVIAKFRSRNAT